MLFLFFVSSSGLERIIVARQFSFAVRSTKGACHRDPVEKFYFIHADLYQDKHTSYTHLPKFRETLGK